MGRRLGIGFADFEHDSMVGVILSKEKGDQLEWINRTDDAYVIEFQAKNSPFVHECFTVPPHSSVKSGEPVNGVPYKAYNYTVKPIKSSEAADPKVIIWP